MDPKFHLFLAGLLCFVEDTDNGYVDVLVSDTPSPVNGYGGVIAEHVPFLLFRHPTLTETHPDHQNLLVWAAKLGILDPSVYLGDEKLGVWLLEGEELSFEFTGDDFETVSTGSSEKYPEHQYEVRDWKWVPQMSEIYRPPDIDEDLLNTICPGIDTAKVRISNGKLATAGVGRFRQYNFRPRGGMGNSIGIDQSLAHLMYNTSEIYGDRRVTAKSSAGRQWEWELNDDEHVIFFLGNLPKLRKMNPQMPSHHFERLFEFCDKRPPVVNKPIPIPAPGSQENDYLFSDHEIFTIINGTTEFESFDKFLDMRPSWFPRRRTYHSPPICPSVGFKVP